MSKADVGAPQPASTCAGRRVGVEFRKFYRQRLASGFIDRFLSGQHVLDIGFAGGDPQAVPVTGDAIGVGLDYPGYDGTRLPFDAGSQDAVLASHVLEHIGNYRDVLADWYRVLRVGGFLVLCVPHRYLYERRPDLPSRWNGDHKRFYTAASLLAELEESLPINGFRVRHLTDNDGGFRYDRESREAPTAGGAYEIELVIEKIARPAYSDSLQYPDEVRQIVDALDALIFRILAINVAGNRQASLADFVASLKYITPWARVCRRFVWEGAPELAGVRLAESTLRPIMVRLLEVVEVEEGYYFDTYPTLKLAAMSGRFESAAAHWRANGYFEGRLHRRSLV